VKHLGWICFGALAFAAVIVVLVIWWISEGGLTMM